MCLKAYPNGSIGGLGTHVSIRTCMLQGPFDGVLKWPLRGDITIQIVNQAGEDMHKENVVHYTSHTPDNCAGRVIDKERSGAWSLEKACTHTSLGYNTATNTNYLRGDFFQIQISKVELKN